ncbi:MAG: copper resistance system multicopper oxidase [Betaproteobacteria bacterium]|nr:MAG: copper resistance system multicopper oxidase [Betaproteobacteria bacterium]
MYSKSPLLIPPSLTRRTFVKGLAAGGTLAALSPWLDIAPSAMAAKNRGVPVLSGDEFNLVIEEQPVNFSGKPRVATMINGSIPAPTLRWRLGDTVTLRVTNRLRETTSIHWHGIILPFEMDGVPGISFRGIPPGETFAYRFKVNQTGTYWYHSHSGHQEQLGMYGAIIVDDPNSSSNGAMRDHVVVLSDWTDENPERVFHKLKVHADYFNFNHPTIPLLMRDISEMGFDAAVNKRRMWNEMRMSPADLADVSGYTYTYLMNGTAPAGNWTGLFRPGEKVRLRFINAAANSFFDVRIPGLKLRVVQNDGQDVEPVSVDEFRFGSGETLDAIVSPVDDAYTIFAQSMDRSGYARGTLAVREGLSAEVPATDEVEWLTHRDMMGEMDHGAHGGHSGHNGHGNDGGHADHNGHSGHESRRNHQSHANHDRHSMHQAGPLAKPGQRVRHARTEFGASVDMRVDTPRTNLDDPGIGLRNNGRRVLTYADLSTVGGPMDPRGAEREIELHLTGNMERYTWSFDGLEFGKSTPVRFRYGERLRVILHNDTMMTHPMHMHGMWSELENADGRFQARKHTVQVHPAQRVSFLVDVDAPGRWAWHCHLMFHMHAGMFREIVVS